LGSGLFGDVTEVVLPQMNAKARRYSKSQDGGYRKAASTLS
jgi:hypothetical protein